MTPKEFENGGFTLKTHQMFAVHTTSEEFKNATITGMLDLCLEKNIGQVNHMNIVTISFSEELRFQLPST